LSETIHDKFNLIQIYSFAMNNLLVRFSRLDPFINIWDKISLQVRKL